MCSSVFAKARRHLQNERGAAGSFACGSGVMNMSQSFFRSTSLALFCQAAVSWSASALAQEPSCDLECIKGYSCEMQISGCPDLPRGDTPCEPTPFPSCIAQLCSSDADCAAHMKCYDGNTPGDVRQCLPQHSFSCNADADCGAGFTCAPLNPCLDPADPAVPACVPDAPGDGKLCWVTETRACQADLDCLPDWTCENNPLNGYSSSPSGENRCLIGNPPLVCMPPHASIFGHGAAGFLDWAKGIEWGSRSVPESECPEPTSPHVSYGRGGIAEQGQDPVAIPNGTSDSGRPAIVSDDPTQPTLSTGVPRSENAPLAQAASGGSGCSLSLAASDDAGQNSQRLGLMLWVGLAGMAVARRRNIKLRARSRS
jgi:hypothetical protein